MGPDSEPTLGWLLRSPVGWTLALVWGALWGSFATVCVHRIPKLESVVAPASHCPSCQQPIAWHDNIPILGWLLVRGRCRRCSATISPRYLLLELAALGLAALVYLRFVVKGSGPPGLLLSQFVVYFFFVLVLLVLSAIDIELQILPDRITYPAIPAFFLLGRLLHWQSGGISAGQALGGLVAGYLVVRLLADGYYYLTGREGLGYGDGKLLSLIGGLLGWRALPLVMLVGSCAGLLIGVPLTLWQRRRTTAGPALPHISIVFGPFLSFGAIAYLLVAHGMDVDALLLRALAPLFGEPV